MQKGMMGSTKTEEQIEQTKIRVVMVSEKIELSKLNPFYKKQNKFALDKNVTVIVIIERTTDLFQYGLAQNTLHCYCAYHGYPLILVDLSNNVTLKQLCPQSDVRVRLFSRRI